jgi:putative membrane protein
MVEAFLGKLAQGPASSSQAVKDYGRMLASDHTQDLQTLQTLAKQAGLTMPAALDADHIWPLVGPLGDGLQGKAFDQRYIQDMISGHTQAIALYRQEAQSATNPAVRSYAQKTIPTLQKHLDAAKALQMGQTPSM